jgi:hypothetical protein
VGAGVKTLAEMRGLAASTSAAAKLFREIGVFWN